MSGALPDPVLLACVTIGLVAAFILNEARHAAVAQWRDHHRPPVPGNVTSPAPVVVAAPHPPMRQTPAPGFTPPPRDGIYGTCVMTTDFYDTGIAVTRDHARLRWFIDIPPADEWAGPGNFLKDTAP